MDEITELSTIPKGLESDKVTERKVYRTMKAFPNNAHHLLLVESGF